jgi:hypothetical protein
MAPQDVEFEGIPIKLGKSFDGKPRVLVLPPLSFKSLKKFRASMAGFDSKAALSDESIDLVRDLTEAALKRNYPDLDYSFLDDVLDAGNMMHVMQCVMDVSGMKRREYEESIKGSPADPSTGTSSTGS